MTNLLPLTARQQQVLETIRSIQAKQGFPPTRRELGLALGNISAFATMHHLRALERKGYLTTESKKYRAIKLTVPVVYRLPYRGTVS